MAGTDATSGSVLSIRRDLTRYGGPCRTREGGKGEEDSPALGMWTASARRVGGRGAGGHHVTRDFVKYEESCM